jgi:nucleoside-diphosphate-sugar epimerase
VKVAVIGATGVLGTSAVSALVAAGHEVVALARTPEKAARVRRLGADAVVTTLGDHSGLVALFEGADAVCSLATSVPVGYAAVLPGAWRVNDRLRTEGVLRVVDAAREAGVRRIVQESVSFLYADQGDAWITEGSALDITRATEPATVAESHVVQGYCCDSRIGVALRFGLVVGDDPMTRWQVRAARHGRPVGMGDPESWLHTIHTDDLGSAVVAALHAPSGVYNVGAAPVLRGDYVAGYAEAVGRDVSLMGPALTRLAGTRAEPLTRSLRVSSEHFSASTGWLPSRPTFEAEWLDAAHAREVVR